MDKCPECGSPMVRLVYAMHPGMGGSGNDFDQLPHTVGGVECLRFQLAIEQILHGQHKAERDTAEAENKKLRESNEHWGKSPRIWHRCKNGHICTYEAVLCSRDRYGEGKDFDALVEFRALEARAERLREALERIAACKDNPDPIFILPAIAAEALAATATDGPLLTQTSGCLWQAEWVVLVLLEIARNSPRPASVRRRPLAAKEAQDEPSI